eukprot:gene36330-47282_t
MFTLWVFGPETILILGIERFLVLYFGGGILSSLCHVFSPTVLPRYFPSQRSSSRYAPGLGASGAINGMVVWSILTFPTRILWLYFIIPIPAAVAGTLFVLRDAYGLYVGETGVGNAAHLGGAAFGATYFLRHRFRIK